ncbi:hypothetical protein [Deinococcus rufus]|uniref:Uncharacterized protein n=1 Tax=Deinococcus rufus TaxID=2136097 RepID=A0ABV7Z8Z2_9DEIO
MLDQPPAAFPGLRRAAERPEYARRYWAMVESEHLGVKARWIGDGKEPKPSYEYDTTAREAYIEALRVAAGIEKPPEPTVHDAIAADREAWQRLRQQRRLRA